MRQLRSQHVSIRAQHRSQLRPAVMPLEERLVLSGPSGGVDGPGGVGMGYQFTNWPIDQLSGFQYDATNTQPIVGPQGQEARANADWIFRDPFPVTNLDGTLARIGGWYVVAGLASPRGAPTLDNINYIISRDGVHWQEGGTLISVDPSQTSAIQVHGDQLFSGDIRYDAADDRLIVYYTAVQGTNPSEYVPSPSVPQMRQQIAIATATPVVGANDLNFTAGTDYGIKLVPDGKWYATPEEANTETEVYGFRDPYFFHDPESGAYYLLFTANWGSDQTVGVGSTGDQQYPDAGPAQVDPTKPRNDGVVGMAIATDDTLLNWKLLPPVFGAIGVNTQMELPHIIYDQGNYYLFTTTHNRTFIGDLKYDFPEGMYGFVSQDLSGPYRALNGTGLVVANPPQDPLQTYAWKATAIPGHKAVLTSFINKQGSGTVSPAIALTLDGDRAYISTYQPKAPVGGSPDTVLAFGVTPTAPKGSEPYAIGGGLDAGSDSGPSNSDGITNDRTPTFSGTAPAGTTVRVYAQDGGDRRLLGQATAGADRGWSVTAPELADGMYRITAEGVDDRGLTVLASDLGTTTIDTTAPQVVDASFRPGVGQFLLAFQDGGSGLDPATLSDPSNYRTAIYLGRRPFSMGVDSVELGPEGAPTDPRLVVVSMADARAGRPGLYGLGLASGAITDRAGNPLETPLTIRWLNTRRGVAGPMVANSGELFGPGGQAARAARRAVAGRPSRPIRARAVAARPNLPARPAMAARVVVAATPSTPIDLRMLAARRRFGR